jgi:hypothetical protein
MSWVIMKKEGSRKREEGRKKSEPQKKMKKILFFQASLNQF